jgi:hypothetical protein
MGDPPFINATSLLKASGGSAAQDEQLLTVWLSFFR